ncbi:MAG TPA: ribbon-helix-helix domain-containing protein [Thermoanaerobaculia bacterium]|jgi:Arc/MetJ-type ribon-helix-helix transcriptional regulator
MGTTRITITIDEHVLAEIDRLVTEGVYLNRSTAIEDALHERTAKRHRSTLARECTRLDARTEQASAEEGYVGESEWPEY